MIAAHRLSMAAVAVALLVAAAVALTLARSIADARPPGPALPAPRRHP